MSIVKFTPQTMPKSGKELQNGLHEALKNASPLNDFIQAIGELTRFELRYKMKSVEFYAHFEGGEMGDDVDFVRWATRYEIYQETKAELEQVFDLLEQYALPVAA